MTVQISYYAPIPPFTYDVKTELLGPAPDYLVLDRKTGTHRWHPDSERRGYQVTPGYIIASVNGIDEVIEHKATEPLFSISDDPQLINEEKKTSEPENYEAAYEQKAAGDMIRVSGGCFRMGDTFGDGFPNEKPVHEVCVKDFYIGKYEVTQGQWKAVMGDHVSNFYRCGNNCPVEQVGWDDVQEFIRILNEKTGKTYRLPSEAEWEYAARSGGKNEKYSGGNDLDSVAWYKGNADNRTHPVGQKRPNGLGIYDMSGNVWEWVQDVYSDTAYSAHLRNNPLYNGSGASRVFRGGGWYNDPQYVRTTSRYFDETDYGFYFLGFRLARTK